MTVKCISFSLPLLLLWLNYCEGANLFNPKCNRYYFDPYQDGELLSSEEEMCSLPKATMRTILRGLVAVLTRVFPECAFFDGSCSQREQKKEEPIKIFRQIISCPGVQLPYFPTTCCPPRTQIPPPPAMPTIMHTDV